MNLTRSFVLEVKNLCVSYGSARILENISVGIEQGGIASFIGQNGSGKSTTLRSIFGLLSEYGGRIDSGSVQFMGKEITRTRTDQIKQLGLTLVPEGRRLFTSMTVRENLDMGTFMNGRTTRHSDLLDEILTLFPHLRDRLSQKAGTLSTGEQQMVALGRSLMSRPKFLVADEPTVGLSPGYVDTVLEKLVEINSTGIGVLIVEQKAIRALEISNIGFVFQLGKIVKSGNAQDLLHDPQIKSAYLGK